MDKYFMETNNTIIMNLDYVRQHGLINMCKYLNWNLNDLFFFYFVLK